ncbi:hypothetical protein BX659_12033 [Orenia metallireducens]|jgi:hypothetical protein|uniref:DUF327 domain-containing protein n=1 Tax=Orenia metallireducens TaxID=1413210 RepID=A0A285GYT3_9FIRM|nr:YaaR family protein [Orenia metallireducens]PRX26443.1 hypothetical protein BX659_12033 [Orenia metallireducens]SNY28657.1 hypothetical protein SAMN06265827_11233 [Orenia metallireducens]
MKIDNKLKSNVNTARASGSQVRKIEGRKTDFLEELTKVHGVQIKGKLDELLEMIDQQGERLNKHRTFRELIRYKKMVKQFVKETVGQMYDVQEDYSPMQGKVHTIVKSVDKSLEDLTKMILDEQSSQLDILGKLDEVRGMLVDLYR